MESNVTLYPENSLEKIGFETVRKTALRKCYTPYGRERMENLLPSSARNRVQYHLGLSSEWMRLLQNETSHPLTTVGDLRRQLQDIRAAGSVLPLEEFTLILENARLARVVKQFFDRSEQEYPELRAIAGRLVSLKPLEEAIQQVVTERGELRDDASRELKRIRSALNRERNRLRNTIQQVMKRLSSSGMTSDEGATIRNGRMVIPIQAEYKRKVDGFIHDVSSTGQTIYMEPVQALQINNDIRQLEAGEQREIERIILTLTDKVRTSRNDLLENTKQIALLDEVHAKVSLGQDFGGVIPLLQDHQHIKLIRARNPVLLLKNSRPQESGPVVPLDLEMTPDELALVITGPNAGGKSVAMKTAGLLSMMVQSGFPVPVQPDSSLPVLSGLFVDIGDDQSIENDLSTFSSRLRWMRETQEQIQPGALVLIDEAGAGTDPEEGGALFQAFVEEVVNRGSRVIVTTHHGSLKVFAHENPSVVNGAMEFDQENLSPTYRFKKGVPGSSYAFEIADRMALPPALMERARNLLGEQGDKMGDLLVTLEKKVQHSEEIRSGFEKRLREVEKREKIYHDRAESLEKKREKILEKAYQDAGEIMKGANRRIEEAVEKVVSEGRDDKARIKEARREVLEAKKEIENRQKSLGEDTGEQLPRSDEQPVVGDFVLIGDNNTRGELIELSGKKATVLVNGMKIKSNLKKLIKTDPPSQKKKNSRARSYTLSNDVDLSVKPSIDLRGKRGEEAVKKLTLYLDNAVARGLKQAEIIHGKGEGILLKIVHETLDKRSEVASFDIAPWDSGGSGCTVVHFK